MNTSSQTAPSASPARTQPHPSPHRSQVGAWSLWFAILAAPLAWTLQLLINSTLAGNACYPHDVPLAQPAWPQLLTVSGLVEGVALLICIAAGGVAWRNWLRSRNEADGDGHRLVSGGDGRTRFMAMVGILTSALFLLATAVALGFVLKVLPCGG